MKKILTLLLIAGFFACSRPPSDMADIKGVINNPSADEVEIFYYKDYLLNETESIVVSLDSKNRFSARLPMSKANFIFVRAPGRTIQLYTLPGASVWVDFDVEKREDPAVVKGYQSYESEFLTAYVHDIERYFGRNLIVNRVPLMDASGFSTYVDSVHTVKSDYLLAHEDFNNLDSSFVKIMQANISYDRYRLLLEYPIYFAHFHDLTEPVSVFDGYYDFLAEATQFKDELVESRPYVHFLYTYLNYLIEKNHFEGEEDKSYYQIMFDHARANFDGASRDFLLSQVVISALSYDDFETAQLIYEDYSEFVTEGEYKAIVDSEYQTVFALTPGNTAPDFTLTDITGDTISLSDFRGKVVYLDFWASWCGICMGEMEHAKELMRKMAVQYDLVFLFVSVDTDEAAWRNTVADQDIPGIHVNVSGIQDDIPAMYHVKSVPAFFIIGRDGKIYDNKPPRPGNPLLLSLFMAALLE